MRIVKGFHTGRRSGPAFLTMHPRFVQIIDSRRHYAFPYGSCQKNSLHPLKRICITHCPYMCCMIGTKVLCWDLCHESSLLGCGHASHCTARRSRAFQPPHCSMHFYCEHSCYEHPQCSVHLLSHRDKSLLDTHKCILLYAV